MVITAVKLEDSLSAFAGLVCEDALHSFKKPRASASAAVVLKAVALQ